MKKLLFISLLLIGYSNQTNAQCTPDTTITKPGIYPRNLPNAREDSVYDETIQFKMPKDTASQLGTVTYDSISITNISNIPKGLSYSCSPFAGYSACTWPGGANGCLRLFGKADSGTYGKYFCIATLRAYVFIGGNVTYFETTDTLLFKVNSKQQTNGVSGFDADNQHIKIYPNPVSDELYITLSPDGEATYMVSLTNLTGQVLLEKQAVKGASSTTIQLSTAQLPKGCYLLKVSSAYGERVIKVLK